MKKSRLFLLITVLVCALLLCSCALLRGTLDKKSGFSQFLKATETSIRQEEWIKATQSLEESQKRWKKLKPIMQIDIDHDYINDIENNFVILKAYIENQEKAPSLATILLIQENWESIGEM